MSVKLPSWRVLLASEERATAMRQRMRIGARKKGAEKAGGRVAKEEMP